MEQLHLPHHHGAEAQIPALCRELEKTEKFQTIADVFRQLGDPTRCATASRAWSISRQ